MGVMASFQLYMLKMVSRSLSLEKISFIGCIFYTQVYTHKIQVKFEFGYNPLIFIGVMAPFWFHIHCFVRTLEFHIRSIA